MITELHGGLTWERYQNTRSVKSLNKLRGELKDPNNYHLKLSLKIDIVIALVGGRARTQNQHF